MNEKIADRCPSCGGAGLFIGGGGWITCPRIGCKLPGMTRNVNQLKARVAELEKSFDLTVELFATPAFQSWSKLIKQVHGGTDELKHDPSVEHWVPFGKQEP